MPSSKMPIRHMIALAGAAFSLAIGMPTMAEAQSRDVKINYGGENETSKSIVLPLNKAALVELPVAAADVIVSQPTLVDAVVRSPRRVFLLGLDVGQTNAFFFDARGREILNLEIRVERDLDALEDLLARLMPSSRITAEAINDNIILKGSVESSLDAANAKDIAARFVDDVEKVVSMVGIRQREQVMLKVRIVEMQRSVAKNLGIDLSGVASLSRSFIDTAASNIGAAGTAGLALSATRSIGDNGSSISAFLQALERIGIVKTLAEPTLTAVSGESANFLAGGEFPIPIGQEDGVISIEFKQFGVGLGFTPLVLDKGRINIKVSTEVSEVTSTNNFTLNGSETTIPGIPPTAPPPDEVVTFDRDGDGIVDDAQNVTDFLVNSGVIDEPQGDPGTEPTTFVFTGLNIPAFNVRRAETTVELPSGGSLVLGGLLQENMRQTVNGIPGLKNVPVLGQLFRSRDYQNAETELVIIATPYLVKPTHGSKLTDPTKGFVAASDMQAAMLGRLTSAYGLTNAGVDEKTLQGPIGFILD
ncbi:MAG: type II and III secretion system protein family protein [Pseudomonadota bacterium]